MADMRRRSPEPPPGAPQIQLKPGLAKETLRELAPLLAEEGINVEYIDVPGLDTLQAALGRAVERHNMTRFTPVGHARDLAVTTLRLVIEALAAGDTTLAAAIPGTSTARPTGQRHRHRRRLHRRRPRPARRLARRRRSARTQRPRPAREAASRALARRTRATDILALTRKGRAFGSLDTLIARQGGKHVLNGSALTPRRRPDLGSRQRHAPSATSPTQPCAEYDCHPRTSVTVLRRWLECALT